MKALLVLLAMLGAGCAAVQPWQKETLSKSYMQFRDTQLSRGFINHAVITLEAAEGGDGTAGGGCGCR